MLKKHLPSKSLIEDLINSTQRRHQATIIHAKKSKRTDNYIVLAERDCHTPHGVTYMVFNHNPYTKLDTFILYFDRKIDAEEDFNKKG